MAHFSQLSLFSLPKEPVVVRKQEPLPPNPPPQSPYYLSELVACAREWKAYAIAEDDSQTAYVSFFNQLLTQANDTTSILHKTLRVTGAICLHKVPYVLEQKQSTLPITRLEGDTFQPVTSYMFLERQRYPDASIQSVSLAAYVFTSPSKQSTDQYSAYQYPCLLSQFFHSTDQASDEFFSHLQFLQQNNLASLKPIHQGFLANLRSLYTELKTHPQQYRSITLIDDII